VHAVTKPVAAVDGAPEWSPSGDWILFSRSAGHRRDGPRTKSLWIVHPDGTGARRIKTGDTADGSGSWAPDGRRIAFARKARLGGADLVVVDITTGHVHRLTSHADNGYPAWSPTGETIMFERAGDLDTSSRVHLWSIRADGSRLHDLGPIANGMQAAWSPDGRRFAFTDDGGPDSAIYLVRADGSGRRQLVPGAAQGDQDPVWSPDSRRVAFGRFNSSGGISVHVVDVTGRNTLRLTY
jgi:Tol biopolymer transport system component